MEAVIDVYLIDPTEYISRRGLLRGTITACLEGLGKPPKPPQKRNRKAKLSTAANSP